jgi:hypothetical protein
MQGRVHQAHATIIIDPALLRCRPSQTRRYRTHDQRIAYARSGHTIAAGSPVRLKGDALASPGCVCKARLSCAGNLVRIRVSSVTDRKFFGEHADRSSPFHKAAIV